jgi:cell division protein FtsB
VTTRPLRTGPGGPRLGRWGHRIALACALAAGLAYLPYRLLDPAGSERLESMRDELFRARGEIDALGAENAALATQIRALKEDPRAIEDIARLDLGMVRPGELVIRVEAP